MGIKKKELEILLVEDDPGDIELTMEALEDGKIKTNVNIVNDGVQALHYLHRRQEYKKANVPDLVLLDLNLPRKSGHEVLAKKEKNSALKKIPVIVLSTSANKVDINKAYKLGCSCFVSKPADISQFMEMIKAIEHFWSTFAQLPDHSMD